MAKNILQEHLSKEQLILNEIYQKRLDEPTTIEELKEKLQLPRTTIVEHLNGLEDAGFIAGQNIAVCGTANLGA